MNRKRRSYDHRDRIARHLSPWTGQVRKKGTSSSSSHPYPVRPVDPSLRRMCQPGPLLCPVQVRLYSAAGGELAPSYRRSLTPQTLFLQPRLFPASALPVGPSVAYASEWTDCPVQGQQKEPGWLRMEEVHWSLLKQRSSLWSVGASLGHPHRWCLVPAIPIPQRTRQSQAFASPRGLASRRVDQAPRRLGHRAQLTAYVSPPLVTTPNAGTRTRPAVMDAQLGDFRVEALRPLPGALLPPRQDHPHGNLALHRALDRSEQSDRSRGLDHPHIACGMD